MAHAMPCKPGSACSICKHKKFCKGNSETQFIGRKSMKGICAVDCNEVCSQF